MKGPRRDPRLQAWAHSRPNVGEDFPPRSLCSLAAFFPRGTIEDPPQEGKVRMVRGRRRDEREGPLGLRVDRGGPVGAKVRARREG